MSEIQAFITWFLNNLPSFLMTEPICYFIGFAFLGLTVRLVYRIINSW